jgi:hypothetical protein
MMLVDKGYYDYDFERKKEVAKQVLYEDTVKSDDEVRSWLARFGIGNAKRSEESLEELQEMAMKQIAQGDSQVHKKV